MTGSLDITLTDTPRATREATPRERASCFHCGEPCADHAFAKAEKTFCCNGCLVVHDLLTESGLGHFYDLSPSPGVRVRRPATQAHWAFLDEPVLQQRLLDFTDGKQSRVTFHIPAIHCLACVWLLENLFQLHSGIGRSRVNFPKREVAISFAPAKIKLGEIVPLLGSIGYEPALTLGDLEKRAVSPARQRQWQQVGLAGFAFGNIMLFSLPLYLGLDSLSGPIFQRIFGWLSLALALPVLVCSAADYWKAALLSLRQRRLTLDVPIALGLAAIYGQSVFEIASSRGGGYCDSLTGLVFFLLCGRAFQQKTHERLVFDRDYKSFFPLSVTRKILPSRSNRCQEALTGKSEIDQSFLTSAAANEPGEERVSLSQLRVGDRIVLRNGELIPADAKLMNGPAFIDYSFVTGESEPVAKAEGDYLYAGGQQIGAAIEMETVKPVSQSYLTSLWGHEAFRKNGDDDLDTLTNRYSRRFTFIVIAVALGAAAFWIASGNLPRGIKAFTSVLIVACPCALALAAPFTLGTAQRWLVRQKAFLRNALVLERLAKVDAIVFDKTGTLTSNAANAAKFAGPTNPISSGPGFSQVSPDGGGRETVSSVSPRGSKTVETVFVRSHGGDTGLKRGVNEMLSEDEARWIYSLARHSTHPHSVRVGESLAGRHFPEPVRSFLETPGCGIEGQVQGREIWLGSRAWLGSRGARLWSQTQPRQDGTDGSAAADASHAAELQGSVVCVAIDGKYRGAFALTSVPRPDIEQLIRRLAARYDIALLSGDNEKERARFCGLFGDNAKLHFNQSPLDKLGFIRRLQESGKTVMMVGDGLNDAGALKQADVGVAVTEKAGAFSPASDVILEAASVPRLDEILVLARRAARLVRWSFGISAFYNLAGISIAAAGVLSPLVCAVLMPVSSISVVLFACGMTTWAARKGARSKTNDKFRMTNATGHATPASPARWLSPFVIRNSSFTKS